MQTSHITVKASQAKRMLVHYIKAQLVPILTGSPGVGKSDIIRSVAKEFNLKVIDFRLAQCDPTDLLGFPQIKGNKAGYTPMETFPLVGDPLPLDEDGNEMKGWLLFFDELTTAMPAIQAAAYQILLDKTVGQHKLHKNVAMVAAGNLMTDNAIVSEMSTALQSRLVHMELSVDSNEWIEWAYDAGIDHKITDFIKFKPSMLYSFKPDHTDKTYASPRTWEFANRLLNQIDVDNQDAVPLMSGTLSEGVAREFITFCKIYDKLPSIKAIIANPKVIDVPKEPSILFALTGSLANNADENNIGALLEYSSRMSPEFQVVMARETIRRNKKLMSAPAMVKWISNVSSDLW